MLSHGADPNIDVDDGYTCLLSAIESEKDSSLAVVDALIKAGADINDMTGSNGWSPLHMAASRGRVEIAELLIQAGADVNRRKEIDGEETPLMEAASSGHPVMVKLLLAHGADPSLRDSMSGYTALEEAQIASQGADPEVIAFLKDEQFDIDVDVFEDLDNAEKIKEMVGKIDMTQMYIDSANETARQGNHQEVIRLLRLARRQRLLRLPYIWMRKTFARQ